ncbi:hypothetical protein AGMMS49545_10870 [Betaproteobacteria bacterium]|nr:hypothetical protein AGMMS49545_10870 [Betaproteobacteria bacterium]GHU44570.1 hypothetical protein AGMMS50289_13160 [Betaproteobacteria bacterium]
MNKSLLLILCLFSCGASAQQVYKCLQDGKTTISTQPCPPGATSTAVPVEATPNTAMTPEQEVANMKRKADDMERERLNRAAERAAAAPPAPAAQEETEAVNAHGRLNAARRKREEANKPAPPAPAPIPAPAPSAPPSKKPGASGASDTGNASGVPRYIEI